MRRFRKSLIDTMNIAYIGLGKMGRNMVERLITRGYTVIAYDSNPEARVLTEKLGATVVDTIGALIKNTSTPRTIWVMVPHHVVETVLGELKPHLGKGDTIIEGGNSPFKESIRRHKEFAAMGVAFLDAGISGGPGGAKDGACIMVGGTQEHYEIHEPLFKDLAVLNGYAYVGSTGAGHFVKMVHNGIEYGMMQALAEGFDMLQQAQFEKPLPLTAIANLYNHGSVIESRLVLWLLKGFETYGEDLRTITGSAQASGEGLWTVKTAKDMGIPVDVIEGALTARKKSLTSPSYQGQLISVMRNQFGGHDATSLPAGRKHS
ncbi:MAG: 6-phosphogluconate dehydrogenase, decarboxylating [Parcubacteria group bacterium GW2011_GWA2_43_11]|nr:MAG: 6-phosphogluconate dehydrogenase, decarboxylating [Parcubacteria group bacterium GW2011_GWC2_42_11]KKS86097.1 MAG: 6-phosphogluconate dehydrogenase, decarboxylating [Parcubacteria group bacterium GW2011_GWA2_43_11]